MLRTLPQRARQQLELVAPHADAGLLQLLQRRAEARAARNLDLDRVAWRSATGEPTYQKRVADGRGDGENNQSEKGLQQDRQRVKSHSTMECARLNRYGLLAVTGADARDFLHAQLTNDIAKLAARARRARRLVHRQGPPARHHAGDPVARRLPAAARAGPRARGGQAPVDVRAALQGEDRRRERRLGAVRRLGRGLAGPAWPGKAAP